MTAAKDGQQVIETYRGKPGKAVERVGAQPDNPDAEAAADMTQLDVGGAYSSRLKRPVIEVAGLYEGIDTVMVELAGSSQPTVIRGPAGDRLGSVAAAGSRVLAQRPECFRKLLLPVDFPAPEQDGDDHGQQGQEQPRAKGRGR